MADLCARSWLSALASQGWLSVSRRQPAFSPCCSGSPSFLPPPPTWPRGTLHPCSNTGRPCRCLPFLPPPPPPGHHGGLCRLLTSKSSLLLLGSRICKASPLLNHHVPRCFWSWARVQPGEPGYSPHFCRLNRPSCLGRGVKHHVSTSSVVPLPAPSLFLIRRKVAVRLGLPAPPENLGCLGIELKLQVPGENTTHLCLLPICESCVCEFHSFLFIY